MSSSASDEHEFLNSFYIGINIENILYGIELMLYFKTVHVLLSNGGGHKISHLFYALFSSMMVFSVTVWITTKATFGQKMWLLHSDFPGGPYAYWSANSAVWYMDLATVTVIGLQLMTDALMMYRCRIICNSFRVVIVPALLWIVTLVLGVLVTWVTSLPEGNYYSGVASHISLAYWTTSVFLNATLTCMICYRVVRHGRKAREYLGNEYASLYFTIVTIVIESVLPYTLSGVAFLASLGVGSPTSTAFICVYLLMMCISPQMLILRVVAGKAWNNDTFNRAIGSTLKFSPASGDMPESESHWPGGNGDTVRGLRTLSDGNIPDGDGSLKAKLQV